MERRSKTLSRRSFISAVAGVSAEIGNIAQERDSWRGPLGFGQIDIVRTRVFPAGPNGGNPCPVVLSADSLNDGEMQNLARRFGLDTVFVLQLKRNLRICVSGISYQTTRWESRAMRQLLR